MAVKVTTRPLQAATLRDIRRYAHQALEKADALEATPTPLADVELAAGLLPAQAMLALEDDLPPAFAAIAAKLASKVEGGLDTAHKQVYLREDLWAQRRRFVHGHEIGHRALPWHEQAYYADDSTTLDLRTRDELEREANAFSAELLFGIDRFALLADDMAPSIQVPLDLAPLFDTSAHSALRRYVDTSAHRVALLALGRMPNSTSQGPWLPVITAQCGQSGSFAERYGPITQIAPPGVLLRDPVFATAHRCSKGQVIQDAGEMVLLTRRGQIRFSVDAFTNGRLTFVLLRARTNGGRVAA